MIRPNSVSTRRWAATGTDGGQIVDEDFGRTAMLAVPGAGQMMLYQAHHELAHQLDD